jgi:chromosome segregation ATPase
MTHPTDQHDERLAEREQAVSDARAALRAEREQIASDRAVADRLLAEARAAHRDAARDRDRARRLAGRFVRSAKHRYAAARKELDAREAKLAAERERLNADLARLVELRSEFHTTAAATRDRLRDAWAAVESQQSRAAEEWTEADRYFTEQTAQLDARAAELARREKALADRRARDEAETVGLREEAAALEARVENARAALAELEARRDRVRAELLATPPLELPAITSDEPGNLDGREALEREKAAVAALKASLESELAGLDDRKRVLAEQFALLAGARAKWQAAERQTVIEMEDMARDLRQRESDVIARERRLIRADGRRRDDAYNLWQLRLRLEAWQTKLTAFEVRWHTERGQLEADLERRLSAAAHREADLEELFSRWEKAREGERERLRAELEYWAADRERLAKAADDFTLQRQLLDAELSTCAARALAAEELVARVVPDGGSDRAKRRLAVMRKRWERVFDRKVKEIDTRRAEVAAEFTALGERYRRLHALMAGVLEREASANKIAAAADLQRVGSADQEPKTAGDAHPTTASAELAALRDEVERLAALIVELEPPEPPDLPDQELPWGTEEPDTADVLRFETGARAA